MIETVDYDGMLLDDTIAGFCRVAAGSSSWNVDAGGDWSVAANWTNGVPGGVGAVASFSGRDYRPCAPLPSMGADVGSLTLRQCRRVHDRRSDAHLRATARTADIDVNSGSHTIAVPLSIAAGKTVTKVDWAR